MEDKKLKFAANLVPLVLSGEKTVTWRMFDDKDLKVGDNLALIDFKTKTEFGQAKIISVREKRFGDIQESDFDGHEEYQDKKEMLETYRSYYGNRVHNDTLVKIIKFELIKMNY